jgi:predicted HTH transcriptional regulator
MQLALVDGRISPSDYAKGLVSLKMISPGQYETVLREAAEITEFLSYHNENQSYTHTLQSVILEGEGDHIEFKSTLRWDIRAGKTNPAIERACLKTIAAFLNSRGGILLIGVRDDGSIEGIETDKFPNEDKFLLHLWTLVRTCFGKDFSPYIRTTLEKSGDRTVCQVNCVPAVRPAFLRQPGFDEELYIRVGPSSNALNISEALAYIKERFHAI